MNMIHLIRSGEVWTTGLESRSISAPKLTTSGRCNQSLLLECASGIILDLVLNDEVEPILFDGRRALILG